jgi:hypothetical protein
VTILTFTLLHRGIVTRDTEQQNEWLTTWNEIKIQMWLLCPSDIRLEGVNGHTNHWACDSGLTLSSFLPF